MAHMAVNHRWRRHRQGGCARLIEFSESHVCVFPSNVSSLRDQLKLESIENLELF